MPEYFFYILFGVTFLMILLSWLKSENLFNPVSIFNMWWGFFIFVATLDLGGLRIPSVKALLLLVLSQAMFSLGGLTFISPEKKLLGPRDPKNLKNAPLALRIFLPLQILLTFFLLIYLVKAIGMLRSMDPGSFRALVFDNSGVMGENRKYFFFIILPSLYASAFTSITGVFFYRVKLRYLILSLSNLILYSMVTIGRAPIFIAIMGFSFGLIYVYQLKKIKIKFRYVLLVSIPVIYLISMSVYRKAYMSGSKTVFTMLSEYIVWYFTGAFTAFDYFLDFCKEGVAREYSYGRAMIAGIEDYFYPILRRIFPGYTPVNEHIHDFTKIFRSLGGAATHHNSHYTMVMEFMWDAGYYGVVILPYIFGAIIAKVYNSFRTNHSIATFASLILLTYLSLMGIMRWELRYVWSWGTLAGIFFLAHKFVVRKTPVVQ